MPRSRRPTRPGQALNPAVADLCAQALGLDANEVDGLHEEAELLPALLASLILEARRGARRDVQPEGREFCSAVFVGWGASPFTAAEVLGWAEQNATPTQRAALAALRTLCPGLDAQRLGMTLATLPGIECAGQRRGSKLWAVRDLRD